ncbi:MAG TPA: 3'-5' exonuclease, partial [Candidatus Paceibacterota bacterium]
VANIIIEKNNFRIPKKLFTENKDGEKVGVFEARSEREEADFICTKCKELIDGGVKSDEIAVLYRANFQSRVLEEAFLALGVPYQMLGTKFFERKEIKDLISFVRASINSDTGIDFLRIINIPPRGIGKTTIEKILAGKEVELPESTKIKINNFKLLLNNFREVLLSSKISEAIKYIIQKSGIEEMYKNGKEEDSERLENIMELVSLAKEYDDYSPEEALDKFLTDSSLASDQDSLHGERSGVKLMTVHSSKGLEFKYVFVCGLEEDLFPHKKLGGVKQWGEDGEEERRLFYVALTRAGEKLFLTWARMRTIFGNIQMNSPSEFLDDVPEEYSESEYFVGNTRKPLFSIDF